MQRRDFLKYLFQAGLACPILLRPRKLFSLPPKEVRLLTPEEVKLTLEFAFFGTGMRPARLDEFAGFVKSLK